MTESGLAEGLQLSMSVVGYEVAYVRSKSLGEPSGPPESWVHVTMSVKGATVEHHQDRPISRVSLGFVEGPFDAEKVGELEVREERTDIAISAQLPWADFAGFWAALRLDRVATLGCIIRRGTNDVLTLRLRSEGSLYPLFPS
jgi:hypothetical protein